MSASSTRPTRLLPSRRSMSPGVTLKRSEKKLSGRGRAIFSVIWKGPILTAGAGRPQTFRTRSLYRLCQAAIALERPELSRGYGVGRAPARAPARARPRRRSRESRRPRRRRPCPRPGARLAAEGAADHENGGQHLVESALVGAEHGDAGADELGDDIALQIREAEHEVGLEGQDPIRAERGEAPHARPLARRLRTPRGARHPDHAVPRPHHERDLRRLGGETDDALRELDRALAVHRPLSPPERRRPDPARVSSLVGLAPREPALE